MECITSSRLTPGEAPKRGPLVNALDSDQASSWAFDFKPRCHVNLEARLGRGWELTSAGHTFKLLQVALGTLLRRLLLNPPAATAASRRMLVPRPHRRPLLLAPQQLCHRVMHLVQLRARNEGRRV